MYDWYPKTCQCSGKYTVPVLWDKQNRTIVNNESIDLIQILNSDFNSVAKNADLDLIPKDIETHLEELNSWIYNGINNGVYRCGFATKQAAYEKAFEELFSALDRAEAILSQSRYLCGDRFTWMDIRLFMTLIRFDPVRAATRGPVLQVLLRRNVRLDAEFDPLHAA
jgi:glutathionyl-hydroquinone reductase